MILAAGRGTRLGALGLSIPKALVEIGGEPLLARQLNYLTDAGVERIVVNAHHLSDQIVEFVAQHRGPAQVDVSVEPDLLGTAGGVRAALDRFDKASPIIVVYGDTVLDAPLRSLFVGHVAARADATIAVNWLENTEGKGLVEVDAEGFIVSFSEKPAHPRPGLANAGLYVLEPELIKLAPDGQFCDFALDLFPCALGAGRRLRADVIETAADDIGTPDALARAQANYSLALATAGRIPGEGDE